MVKHIWSVLCERVSIDQNTNIPSYLSCIEKITAKKLPAALQNLTFSTRWFKYDKSEESLFFQLSVVNPKGEEKILIEPGKQIVKSDNYRLNIILSGLLFKYEGYYNFKLKMRKKDKWIIVQEIPFNVALEPSGQESNLTGKKDEKEVVLKPKIKKGIARKA